jgi:hypothetical protein
MAKEFGSLVLTLAGREVKDMGTADNATGANLCIIATLSDPQIGPDSAAEQGLEELVQV